LQVSIPISAPTPISLTITDKTPIIERGRDKNKQKKITEKTRRTKYGEGRKKKKWQRAFFEFNLAHAFSESLIIIYFCFFLLTTLFSIIPLYETNKSQLFFLYDNEKKKKRRAKGATRG